MLALRETMDKINTLNEENAAIIINLVDYLSNMQQTKGAEIDAENPFHLAWEEGSKNPMSEEETATLIEEVRRERHAGRH